MGQKYDVAAFIWPAYSGNDPRTLPFWEEGNGEWQTVKKMKPLFEGHQWPRKPLWGYVNEADPYVMEMEIEAAAAHGVNVFIYDWYWFDNRPFLENCLNDGYLKARNNDKVKFYLMWANHDADTSWDKRFSDRHILLWDGAVSMKTFEYLIDRTIDKYFTHPSYYKINGKPVYMIYHLPNRVRGLGGVEAAKRGLELFRERTVKAGFAGLELQNCIHGHSYMNKKLDENTTVLDFSNTAGFDSCTIYQFRDFISNTNRPYPEVQADMIRILEEHQKKLSMPIHPHVSLGWDSNPRYNIFHDDVCTENTPENIEQALRYAKEQVDTRRDLSAPLITLNSWNEWTEGSYLQPDDLYGYGYLEAVKKVFG